MNQKNTYDTMMRFEDLEFIVDEVGKAPPGWVVVAGTYQGGDVMAIRKAHPDRKILVLDSFEGLSEAEEQDMNSAIEKHVPWKRGEGMFSVGGVDAYLERFEKRGVKPPDEIVKIWLGYDSLDLIEKREVALLWSNLDLYEPTKASLQLFDSMAVPGGVAIVFGYKFSVMPGVDAACDEYSSDWKDLPGKLISHTKK